MNHQTAKIIAESYRKQADMYIGGDSRRTAMLDHAAVWERVAQAIARDEYPLGKEAPHVP